MLYLNLEPVFRARGITDRTRFLLRAGFTRNVAYQLLHTDYRAPRLDHLERLCHALLCTPNDILAWKPGKGDHVPENHPLHTLAPKPVPAFLLEELNHLPLQQLSHIQTLIRTALEVEDAVANAPQAGLQKTKEVPGND